MSYTAILYEKKDSIATITLNQPESLNSLVQAMFDDLIDATKEVASDDDVKVVILTGAGRAFCAGGDINRFKEGFDHANAITYVDDIDAWALNWINLKKPTIAMLNGPAVGAGMSLSLLCDITIASDRAKMGSAFINMGLVPDIAAAYFLPRTVGVKKAKELLYTGNTIDAEEALSIGLVNRVVSHDRLAGEVWDLASKMAAGPGFGIANTKRIIHMGLDIDLSTLLKLEGYIQGACLNSDDSKAAVDAFLNKKPLVFTGR